MFNGNLPEQSWENEILSKITEGMEVYDKNEEKVGEVEFVQLGAHRSTGAGSATNEGSEDLSRNLADDIINAFSTKDQIPDEVRERLIYNGFIRVNTSRLFASDRYIIPEQINRVEGDRVYLRANYEDLITRSSS